MKKSIAFILVTLLGWNIILTIMYVNVHSDVSSISDNKQTKAPVEQMSTNITSDLTKLVEKSENKVVTITAKRNNRAIGSGSGAIYKIDGKTLYIITNNHVVSDSDENIVTFSSGKEQKATIVGKDALTDIALLKLDVDFQAEAFTSGDSSKVKKGEYVIAMGSPLGVEYQGSVAGGLISGVNRRMEMDIDQNGEVDWDVTVLQTDAAINPGNSGGPLINMAGELIGINSMKISETSVEGFGFALPINEVIPIVNELESKGKVARPILGISVQPIGQLPTMDKVYLDIDEDVDGGMLVVKVAPKSPAEKAGVHVKDIVIKMDGKEVEDQKQFRHVLYNKKINDKITITVLRNNKEIEMQATLK